MAEQSSKRRKKKEPVDTNELAFDIVQDLTSEEAEIASPLTDEKRRAGRAKGGKSRATKLSPKRRSDIARKAARKRWGYEEE